MKNYKAFLFVAVFMLLLLGSANAQTINWAGLKPEDKHIVNANFGIEYGLVYGLGYGYHINTRLFPIVANVEYSFPSGNKLFDDSKTRIGGQIRWAEYHHFQFSTKVYGVFRRYQNDFVRLVDFGSDMSGVVGYYRSKWFVAGEVGFDKAISTHFKNSSAYKDQYPGATNGWYKPATGGNFYYGLQTGFSFKKNDIYIRAGKIITQDFKTTPIIPFYVQLGYNIKF